MSLNCLSCGRDLLRGNAVEGLCPGCLVALASRSRTNVNVEAVRLTETEPEMPSVPEVDPEAVRLAEIEPEMPSEMGLRSGLTLGNRYRVHGLLGRGGMGEVWWAIDLKLGVEVALKSLRAELLADESALRRLRDEVRMARQVVSPNVCRVFDLIEIDGRELVSMERVDGQTLREVLKERSPLNVAEARQIAAQLLAGLSAIHGAGLVHRDVKLENVMVTRSGRVVLMDLGIARSMVRRFDGTVSGTPAYMAPEQRCGEPPTEASDVFSVGVVLAEMVAPGGAASLEARRAVWSGIQREPPEIADTPWAPVILKAIARRPEERFSDASALARALDEVSLRAELASNLQPYPGLAAFTSHEAEYFFGRELEVEEMWRKLHRVHLLALVGPSGVGKSSFIRAGLLPAIPPGWRAVITTPGSAPLAHMVQALGPELADDASALKDLVEDGGAEALLEAVGRWRRRHHNVVVVLDQFEELFTLNPPELQEKVAALLRDLVVEADARVLVSIRDDLLFRCADQPALSPLFSNLTPLRALAEAALHRALVQPALKCGYRFEDEALVDEIIAGVREERGALPMLAFAAAQLWDHRDRRRGLLTRAAYEHIGGVGAALVRHAEKTLEEIGTARVPVVRELFRNLVTADGTRATRSWKELLSVFEVAGEGRTSPSASRHEAEVVLDALVRARLLTSYELPVDQGQDEPAGQMVEIIHDSLLTRWPRLVRWRAQDQDGALLRDQLRQAARTWHERGRPEDVVWSGTAYREFSLWRERYGGRLTDVEEAFAQAMRELAHRRRTQRRRLRATAATLLLVGAVSVSLLWQRAERQTLRAEANELLALERVAVVDDPTSTLAFALASLERADDQATRLLVVKALQSEPPAFYLPATSQGGGLPLEGVASNSIDFSPDGGWLAIGTADGRVRLWRRTGEGPTQLSVDPGNVIHVRFGPDSDVIYTRSYPSQRLQAWSTGDGQLLRTLPIEGPIDFRMALDAGRLFTFRKASDLVEVESWPLDGGDATLGPVIDGTLGEWSKYPNPWNIEVDSTGRTLAYAPYDRGPGEPVVPTIFVLDAAEPSGSGPRLVGHHPTMIGGLTFAHDGRHIASADDSGEVRIWNLESDKPQPERILHHLPGPVRHLRFDPGGTRLVAVSLNGQTTLWNLDDPPGADPMLLARHDENREAIFSPDGEWLASAGSFGTALRPLQGRYTVDLRGPEVEISEVLFLPDGDHLVAISQDGTLRLWPLSAGSGEGSRVVFDGGEWLDHVVVSPSGRRLLVVSVSGAVWSVPLAGDERPRMLEDFDGRGIALALGEDVAVASGGFGSLRSALRVWNLGTGDVRTIETGHDRIIDMVLTQDGRLVASHLDGIRIWNLDNGTSVAISDSPSILSASRDRRLLLVARQGAEKAAELFDLEAGTSTMLGTRGPCSYGALDASGEIAVTTPFRGGPFEVGRIDGGPVHLIAVEDDVYGCAFSPDGRWLATLSKADGSVIHLHPVPDLARPPLQTVPRSQLIAMLRRLTNLRVRLDPGAKQGWRWELDRFPGWEEAPRW